MTTLYDEYSPWKAAHFPDRIELLKRGERTAPVHLQIGLTNNCNHSCFYCFVDDHNKLGATLDTSTLIKLLEDSKEMGVEAITLTGAGEPSVHKDFYQIVDKIRELDMELGVITNGSRIKVPQLSFASWVRVSIDTYEPDVYKKMRNSKIPNLENLKSLCQDTNVIVGASCVITEHNYAKLYEFAVQSKNIGFKNVWFNPVQFPENPDVLEPYWEECEEQLFKAQKLSNENFKVFCPKSRVGAQGEINKPFSKCLLQHFTAYIWANGDIYPCCETQGMPEYAVGNIYNGSFMKVWSNSRPLEVKDCHFPCLRRDKNLFFNYLVADYAPHANFV